MPNNNYNELSPEYLAEVAKMKAEIHSRQEWTLEITNHLWQTLRKDVCNPHRSLSVNTMKQIPNLISDLMDIDKKALRAVNITTPRRKAWTLANLPQPQDESFYNMKIVK